MLLNIPTKLAPNGPHSIQILQESLSYAIVYLVPVTKTAKTKIPNIVDIIDK